MRSLRRAQACNSLVWTSLTDSDTDHHTLVNAGERDIDIILCQLTL